MGPDRFRMVYPSASILVTLGEFDVRSYFKLFALSHNSSKVKSCCMEGGPGKQLA